MRDHLIGLLETADLALASSAGVIDDDRLVPLIEVVRAVRTRLTYPDDVLVVALAGGTGSGKSSLFNAYTGEDLVDVGGIRPTTSHPAAAIPVAAGPSLDGYLDRLSIDRRHRYEGSGICLIDLPDTDSVEVEHRHRVDVILPLVDLVIWVTDPEKYRDSRLHNDYLKPLSAYSGRFLFVMNQIDRLSPAQAEEVCHDLGVALASDGIDETLVLPMAAGPPNGPPIGLDRLSALLESKREDREALYEKLLTDLAGTSRALEAEAGPPLDFDTRAGDAVTAATEFLVEGDLTAATGILTDFLDDIAAEAGGPAGAKVERIAAEAPRHVRRIETELSEGKSPRRQGWFRRRQDTPPSSDHDRARVLLSEAMIRPVRAVLAGRAVAMASIAGLVLEVESLRRQPRR